MGYNTDYTLTYFSVDHKAIEAFVKGNYDYPDFLLELVDGFSNNGKWYEHSEEMRKLSVAFPEIHFELQGFGEEQPDAWVKHFLGGKMQKCEGTITFPPFDKNKLT